MNKEAQDFWDRAVESLGAAEELLPKYADACASRAYYAAFHAVSAWFALRGQTFTRHSAVETAVHRDLVKAGHWPSDLGKAYSFLLELRFTGDYGGGKHVSREEAEKAVHNARRILQAVHQLNPEAFPIPKAGFSPTNKL